MTRRASNAVRTTVPDTLRSYGTAIRLLALSAQHEQGLTERTIRGPKWSAAAGRRRPLQMQGIQIAPPFSPCRLSMADHATV